MMTKKRMLAAGAAVLLTLGGGAGLAGATQSDSTPTTPSTTFDMDAMHDRMRTSMPEDLQTQCDAAHSSMQGHMSGGMGSGMGAGGMMSGR